MHRMGHVSAAAALRYQHATRDRHAAIAAALGALIGPAPAVTLRRPRATPADDAGDGSVVARLWPTGPLRLQEELAAGTKTAPNQDHQEERVTGIEPAFSAWESERRGLPDLRRFTKAQVRRHDRCPPVSAGTAP